MLKLSCCNIFVRLIWLSDNKALISSDIHPPNPTATFGFEIIRIQTSRSSLQHEFKIVVCTSLAVRTFDCQFKLN